MKKRTRRIFSEFMKYMVPGALTTFLEVSALVFFLSYFKNPRYYLLAVAITFVVGTTIQYAVTHWWVFEETSREFEDGYIYFMVVALVGLFMTLGGIILLSSFFHVRLILARIIVAIVVGLWNFFANYFLSFRMHKEN